MMDAISQGFQCISGRVPIGTSKFHYHEAGSNAKGMSKLLYIERSIDVLTGLHQKSRFDIFR